MSHASVLIAPQPRIDSREFIGLMPDVYEALTAISKAAAKAGLDADLLELVKVRASQINGCAYCLQFHLNALTKLQVAKEKTDMVAVWREAPQFSRRERAALAWTEALTTITDGVSDELTADVRSEFSDKDLAYLSSTIGLINTWNRLGVAMQWTPPKAVASHVA